MEGASRREHEVTRTIEVQVATRLASIRFNDATKGQRGTSEGTHRGAAAAARQQDCAAQRIITRKRGYEAERRHRGSVRPLTREGELVADGHAAIQLNLQLQGTGSTHQLNVTRPETVIMGHTGDATITGARTCSRDVIRGLQTEAVKGIVSSEHHDAKRGFRNETGEAKGPHNRAGDGEDRAGLGRHR